MKQRGKIKKVVEDKGFGFITPDKGKDIFFHLSGLKNINFDDLQVGQSVEFETEDGKNGKGPRAINITVE